ncbi:hypothetical protein [Staphylococcus gallinarum]|uniref:hypothetical protein n=1 Tax=Staphylococcus gallinarum TaxID=1293 RepID=UPI0030C3CD6A
MKYKIEHSNLDVNKLWNLAKSGVFDIKTIENIFKNDNDGFITFNSKYSFNKYKQYEFSTSAMY